MAGSRFPYTLEEDKAIVKYITDGNFASVLKGNAMWQKMEKDNICEGRTWHSLKNRFKRNIVYDLARRDFGVDAETRTYIRAILGIQNNKASGKRNVDVRLIKFKQETSKERIKNEVKADKYSDCSINSSSDDEEESVKVIGHTSTVLISDDSDTDIEVQKKTFEAKKQQLTEITVKKQVYNQESTENANEAQEVIMKKAQVQITKSTQKCNKKPIKSTVEVPSTSSGPLKRFYVLEKNEVSAEPSKQEKTFVLDIEENAKDKRRDKPGNSGRQEATAISSVPLKSLKLVSKYKESPLSLKQRKFYSLDLEWSDSD